MFKTQIKHDVSYVTVNERIDGVNKKNNYQVGKKVEAKLHPGDPVVGSATSSPNASWMQRLRIKYAKSKPIRGHLLNHDLGGKGVPSNLYPISTKANSDHSSKVEEKVKDHLESKAKDIGKKPNIGTYYRVEVLETVAHDPENASFVCSWGDWDFTNSKSDNIQGPIPIPSLLKTDASNLGTTAADVKAKQEKAKTRTNSKNWKHGTKKAHWDDIKADQQPKIDSVDITAEEKGKAGNDSRQMSDEELSKILVGWFGNGKTGFVSYDPSLLPKHFKLNSRLKEFVDSKYSVKQSRAMANDIIVSLSDDEILDFLSNREVINKLRPDVETYVVAQLDDSSKSVALTDALEVNEELAKKIANNSIFSDNKPTVDGKRKRTPLVLDPESDDEDLASGTKKKAKKVKK